jgi:hypothetical protein
MSAETVEYWISLKETVTEAAQRVAKSMANIAENAQKTIKASAELDKAMEKTRRYGQDDSGGQGRGG